MEVTRSGLWAPGITYSFCLENGVMMIPKRRILTLIITKLQHKEKKTKKRFKESTVRLPKKKTGAINER